MGIGDWDGGLAQVDSTWVMESKYAYIDRDYRQKFLNFKKYLFFGPKIICPHYILIKKYSF